MKFEILVRISILGSPEQKMGFYKMSVWMPIDSAR